MAKLWSVLVSGDYTSSYFPVCHGVHWMPNDLYRQRYDLEFTTGLRVRQSFTPNFFTHWEFIEVKILTFVLFTWMLLSTYFALFSKIISKIIFHKKLRRNTMWIQEKINIIYLQGLEIFYRRFWYIYSWSVFHRQRKVNLQGLEIFYRRFWYRYSWFVFHRHRKVNLQGLEIFYRRFWYRYSCSIFHRQRNVSATSDYSQS
jgi:hypothetical protein